MRYRECLEKLDKQFKETDKILCQFLLLDEINKNCSLSLLFQYLTNKYSEEDSFNYLLKAMNFLDIKFHYDGVCSLNFPNNSEYEIEIKKMFLVNLYKECSDQEFDNLLTKVFHLNYGGSNLTVPMKYLIALTDFIPRNWNKILEIKIIKFASDFKVEGIKGLVDKYKKLFTGDKLIAAPINASRRLEKYEIYKDRTNFCLVYNAYKFKNEAPREGSDHDVEVIRETFENIRGFEVKIEEIDSNESFFKSLSENIGECQKSDMIICFFMSHGDWDHILAQNEDKIYMEDILNQFCSSKCLHLGNKPKLLIFQACRGKDENQFIKTDSSNNQICTIEVDGVSDRKQFKCPELADYFLYFPTLSGRGAKRNTDTGSKFIQLLCDTIKTNYKNASWHEITMIVNGSDDIYNTGTSIQIPESRSSLRKDLYFDYV